MIKKTLTILVVFGITFPLLSCSNSTTASSPSLPASPVENEYIELNYYVWADELLYITDIIDVFNAAHKNININVVPLSNTNYEDKLKKSLSNPEEQVDLFDTKGMAYVIQLVENENAYNITEYVENSILDGSMNISAYGTLFNDITYHEQYYALPMRSTCWALYYNKELFDNAGLPYPSQLTWDEYAALAKKMTYIDGDSQIWGGYFVEWLPNFLALQHGQYLTEDDQQYSRRSIELLNQFYNIDQSHVSYTDIINSPDPSTDVYTRFEAGEIAMVLQGEWMVNILLKDHTTIDWDIAPMPIDKNIDANTTIGQYQFVSISSSCKHPEEAYEFLEFLCGKNGASIYAQNAIVPAYTDKEIINSYQTASSKESTKYFFEAKKYPEQIAIRGYQETIVAFSASAGKYFSGQMTLDEAMNQFELERKEIFR